MDQLKPENRCPFAGFEPCKQLQCALYIQVRGFDHNTGKDVDHWGCSLAWLPHLMIENAAKTREVAASVQSLRNRVAEGNEVMRQAAAAVPQPAATLFISQKG